MNYKILKTNGLHELEILVNEHFKLGYDLVGGVTCYSQKPQVKVRSSQNEIWFCQAIVKNNF